jgi:hypothetical protein
VYPPKDTRIKQLLDAGFNIVDFVHFGIEKYDSNVARAFFNKYGLVSIRTFADDESKDYATPVQYEIEIDNFDQAERFCIEQNKTYHILMNQALKRADSVLWGNILWYDLSKFTVEYSYGPGTPRDIETKSMEDLRILHGNLSEYILPESKDRQLMEVVRKTSLFLTTVRPIVIEFQLYPYPVGLLQEKWVFWEWRRG